MNKLNFSRDVFLKKKKEALTKLNAFRENFERKKKRIEADLEEAGRILMKVGEEFKWWGSLP